MILFKEITKENYLEVINLKLQENQKHFVADNTFSLLQASYEEGLYTRAIYDDETMIGFLLFDYDEDIRGWSLSRFMIDSKFQGKGYGKKSIITFFEYIKKNFDINEIYVSVSIDNLVATDMFHSFGFKDIKKISYEINGNTYNEMRMIKRLKGDKNEA